MTKCLPLSDKDNQWSFCPSIGPAYLFAILFGLTTLAHLVQSIIYRKFYCFVIIMGGLWQTVAFVFRIVSIDNQTSQASYEAWFILILVAPLWINAFVYMVMGRMVYNFLPKKKIFGVRAQKFGLCFVLLDITAFLVQVYGAARASGSHTSKHEALLGIHIYMIGIGVQQAFLLVFTVMAVRFHREFSKEPTSPRTKPATRLLYVLYTVLTLITVRIIFRLIEYANGLHSSIPNHEAYTYCLDSLPMFVALVLLNVVHPGAVMPGKESNFPSRKERKMQKHRKAPSVEDGTVLVARDDGANKINSTSGTSGPTAYMPAPMEDYPPAAHAPAQWSQGYAR